MIRERDGTVHMNFSTRHSNVWFSVHGVDPLFDPGIDENIRLVVPFIDEDPNNDTPNGALEIRPKADGIVDLVQADRSDWSGLGVGLCQVLAGEQATNPIICPPWSP